MPASRSTAPCDSSTSLEPTCESYGVDSRLLYNDIERLSKRCFDYAQRLIFWSRLLAVASMAAAGAAGVAVYYQQAQLYRVWRLRNPRKVQQLVQFATLSGGFSLCGVLFLISPIGLMRLHEKELQWTQQLDAMAVAALVEEQNFLTLAAWAHAAAVARRSKPAPSSCTVSSSPAVDATDTAERGTGEQGHIYEQQWVWKEVVLDPTQLWKAPRNRTASQRPAAPVDTAEAGPLSAGPADADTLVAQKRLASQLLTPSNNFASQPGRSVSDADSSAVLPTWRQQPRRVWGRTANPAELQRLKDECVAMWEGLVAEKTTIAQRLS
ncbi:hypothetical protein CUR178_08268 [Leishmania enriettii]|uniref:Transmembrane protein n=1 Tax=Leishmania enriettii TaxID=5663 RepID=A0A836GYF8_LEIEN|nr:hypothetical protein CUR178_08268 [Leishmania enriettii]